jgi:hypothetical protein
LKELEKQRKLEQQIQDLKELRDKYTFPYNLDDLEKELNEKAQIIKEAAYKEAERVEELHKKFILEVDKLKELEYKTVEEIERIQREYIAVAQELGHEHDKIYSKFGTSRSYVNLTASIKHRAKKGY